MAAGNGGEIDHNFDLNAYHKEDVGNKFIQLVIIPNQPITNL